MPITNFFIHNKSLTDRRNPSYTYFKAEYPIMRTVLESIVDIHFVKKYVLVTKKKNQLLYPNCILVTFVHSLIKG